MSHCLSANEKIKLEFIPKTTQTNFFYGTATKPDFLSNIIHLCAVTTTKTNFYYVAFQNLYLNKTKTRGTCPKYWFIMFQQLGCANKQEM